MTKKQLITALEDVPDDVVIVLSSDEEGNAFHELDEVGTSMLYDLTSGEVASVAERDVLSERAVPAAVLWPA